MLEYWSAILVYIVYVSVYVLVVKSNEAQQGNAQFFLSIPHNVLIKD